MSSHMNWLLRTHALLRIFCSSRGARYHGHIEPSLVPLRFWNFPMILVPQLPLKVLRSPWVRGSGKGWKNWFVKCHVLLYTVHSLLSFRNLHDLTETEGTVNSLVLLLLYRSLKGRQVWCSRCMMMQESGPLWTSWWQRLKTQLLACEGWGTCFLF